MKVHRQIHKHRHVTAMADNPSLIKFKPLGSEEQRLLANYGTARKILPEFKVANTIKILAFLNVKQNSKVDGKDDLKRGVCCGTDP